MLPAMSPVNPRNILAGRAFVEYFGHVRVTVVFVYLLERVVEATGGAGD